MVGEWPQGVTDEERSLRLFKDALMKRAAASVVLFPEDEEDLRRATGEVESAYAGVREHAPEELDSGAAPRYAEVLSALRKTGETRAQALPTRRMLVYVLAKLDYYFFKLASGYERVYDMPHLTDEECAAENGLRHDLLIKLYDELEPAFDVSLNWPSNGYAVDENGGLVKIEAELTGIAAVAYDYGYEAQIFHEGHADDEGYVRGFIEGCLERIGEDEPEEADFLYNVWEGGDEEDREYVLETLKEGCEVWAGRFDDRPEFPL